MDRDETPTTERSLPGRTESGRASIQGNLDRLRSAQKPARGTAAYSRYVNRPLGRQVAALAHRLGISPNQATVVSATLSACGIALIALRRPDLLSAVMVPVLLAAGYVMDSVDGQLARLRGQGSAAGEWLDHTVDLVKTLCLHLAVLIAWYRWPPIEGWAVLLIPMGFLVVATTTYFGLILMPTLRRAAPADPATLPPENPLRAWLLLPVDYGMVCWLFLLLASPTLFLAGYSAFGVCAALALAAALRKWWRELRTQDRERAALGVP